MEVGPEVEQQAVKGVSATILGRKTLEPPHHGTNDSSATVAKYHLHQNPSRNRRLNLGSNFGWISNHRSQISDLRFVAVPIWDLES